VSPRQDPGESINRPKFNFMELPIRINKEKFEKDPEIPQELIDKAVEIAERIKRSEFVIFWLKCKAREPEKDFDFWLEYVQKSSHQELTNMIHELGEEGLKEFVKEFKNKE